MIIAGFGIGSNLNYSLQSRYYCAIIPYICVGKYTLLNDWSQLVSLINMAKGTKTSKFGSNGWVNHDSSEYYSRELMPLWANGTTPSLLDSPHEPENSIPSANLDQIFKKSSEDMSELPDRSVHLMVTSPPYNVGKEYDDALSVEEHLALISNVLKETYRVLVSGGRACINIANIGRKPYIPLHAYIIEAATKIGFFMRGEIIWYKGMTGASTAWGSWMSPSNPTLRDTHEYILVFQKPPFGRSAVGDRKSTITEKDFMDVTKSVWNFPPASAKHAKHPAPFPVELPRRLIQMYTFSDEVVLDPFMGTGATAIAAFRSERHFIGYDISAEYIRLANERINYEKLPKIDDNQEIEEDDQGDLISLRINPSYPYFDHWIDNWFDKVKIKDGETGRVDFRHIATRNYDGVINHRRLTNHALHMFFDQCFNDAIMQATAYPAYSCLDCARESKESTWFGEKSDTCDQCGSINIFEVATFQRRAPVVGAAFINAVKEFFSRRVGIELQETSKQNLHGNHTHNLEIPDYVAIDVKGSPESIMLPGGTSMSLPRAGMRRSDTRKKVVADAQKYKKSNPDGIFFVVTNALPDRLRGTQTEFIDGYFDLTKASQVNALADKLRQLSSNVNTELISKDRV